MGVALTNLNVADLVLQPGLQQRVTSEQQALTEFLMRAVGQYAPVFVDGGNTVTFNTAIVIAAQRIGITTLDCIVTAAFVDGKGNTFNEATLASGVIQTLASFGFPVGPAGGDLTGNYPDPTISAAAKAAIIAVAEAYADSLVVGLWDDRGNYNASVNAYPSSGGSGVAGAILKGDIWTVSVGGVLPTGQIVVKGDTVRALVDTPGNTQANWSTGEGAAPGRDGEQGLAVWSEGEPGEEGIPGTTGPTGAAGATGATGAAGPQSSAVWQEPESAEAPLIIPGPQGLPGATGATGAAGGQGVPGTGWVEPEPGEDAPFLPGAAGAPGASGATGATGAQGQAVWIDHEPGEDAPIIPGPVGATGAGGATGAAGPQASAVWIDHEQAEEALLLPGPQGTTGTTGAPGAAGPQSPAVWSEPESTDDPLLLPGPQGVTGSTGTTGAAGPQAQAVWIDHEQAEEALLLPGPAGAVGAASTVPGPQMAAVWIDHEPGEDGLTIPGIAGAAGAAGAASTVPGPQAQAVWIEPEPGDDPLILPGPQGTKSTVAGPQSNAVWTDGEPGEDAVFPPSSMAYQNSISSVVTPAVPATTVAIKNSTGVPVTIYIHNGTVTAVIVGGVNTGVAAAATTLTIPLAINQTISITYAVAPTWVWIGAQQ